MSEVALIVGGGPGVSASCARLFVAEGMKVAIAARSPEKESMQKLSKELGVLCIAPAPFKVPPRRLRFRPEM